MNTLILFSNFYCILNLKYEGCSLNSVIGLIAFPVSAIWQCALYQMEAGSFPSRQIPNTLIYYARRFGNIAV